MVARPFDPIWPLRDDIAVDSDAIQGISPIPGIWVVGAPETGKSSLIATVDPVRPGQATRTLITDLEMSSTTLQTQLPVEVINIRKMAEARQVVGTKIPFLLTLFETWHDYVISAPDNYTVLGVDPVSDLKLGANLWVKEHASLFGKVPAAYGGKDGTIFSWGDTNLYWKQLIMRLASRYQTIVLTSHESDTYEGGRRTGKKVARSTDFKEIATLTLWLAYNREKNERWAKVEKSRLSWYDWNDEDGKVRRRPVMRELLPKKLIPLYPGQSYPELIAHYMEAPQRDYGALNEVGEDPSLDKMTEEERIRIEADNKQVELDLKTVEERKRLIADLLASGLYKSAPDIGTAVAALNISYSIKEHDAIYKQLAEFARG